MDVSTLSSDEVNRRIAELRGEVCDGHTFHPGVDESGFLPCGFDWMPDYLQWQHCGPLLEELPDGGAWVRMRVTLPDMPVDEFYMLILPGINKSTQGDTLPDAILRAWLQWRLEQEAAA